MSKVYEIRKPISKEMELFEEKFSNLMLSKVPLLNRITHYIIKRKGKQMRPMLIFLCSKLLNYGKVNDKTAILLNLDMNEEDMAAAGTEEFSDLIKNDVESHDFYIMNKMEPPA